MDKPKVFAIFNGEIDDELSSKEKKSDFLKNEVFTKDEKYDLNKITQKLEFLEDYDDFDNHTILVETTQNIVLNCNEVSAISRIDKNIYIEHKDEITEYYFNNKQKTNSLDLSSLSSKFKFYKEDYQISTFLFILGAYAYSDDQKIYSIVLSNNNITSLKFSFNIFFRSLNSIDFTGNPLSPEFKPECDSCYKGISIIKPDPSSTKRTIIKPDPSSTKHTIILKQTDDPKTYIIYNKKFTEKTNSKEFLLSLTNDSKTRNDLDKLELKFDPDWLLIFVTESRFNLVPLSNSDTGITSFDKAFFDENKNEITKYFQGRIQNGYLDLSDFRNKFLLAKEEGIKIVFSWPSQINTLLAIIGILAQKKGIKIKTIDLSNNQITNLKFSFKIFYPEIEKINFFGNTISINNNDICYKDIEIENKPPKEQPKQDKQSDLSTTNKKREPPMYTIFDKRIGPNTDLKIFLRELIKNDNITNSLNPVYDDELKLIRVETDHYLVDKNNSETAITKFDMQFYNSHKNIFNQQIINECLDLSNIKSKIQSDVSARQLSSILIVIGSRSYYSKKIIKKIDLSNNSISNFKFSFKTVFEKLETIVLAGNPILDHTLDDCFNSFKIERSQENPTNLPNSPKPSQSTSNPIVQPKQDKSLVFSKKPSQSTTNPIVQPKQDKSLVFSKKPNPSDTNPILQQEQGRNPLFYFKSSPSDTNKPFQQNIGSYNKDITIQPPNKNSGKIDIKFNKNNNSMYAIFNRKISSYTDAQVFLRRLINNDQITNSLNPVLDATLCLIRVETGYDLIKKNDDENAIAKIDMQFYDENKGAFFQIFELITNELLDLSNIKSKIKSEFVTTRQLSTLLIVIGSWSFYNKKTISTIDLSNNSIKDLKFSFGTVFQNLKKIYLSGNPIVNKDLNDCFKPFECILTNKSEVEEEEEDVSEEQTKEQQQDENKHQKTAEDEFEEEEEEKETEEEVVKVKENQKKIEEEEEEEEEEQYEMVNDDDDDDDELGFEEERNEYYANYINERKSILNRPKFKPFKLNKEAPKRAYFPSKQDDKRKEILKQMPNFCRPKNLPTLADIKAIRLNIHEFPPHEFMSSFFYDSWQQIETIQNYYSINSVFSITVDIKSERDEIDCPSLKFYKDFSRNLFFPNSNNIAVGDVNIASAQKDILFVNGFKAKPTSCSFYQFDENFFYVFHGVFESDIDQDTIPPKRLKEILMFDRSFTIQFQETGFAITNDSLFIHMYTY